VFYTVRKLLGSIKSDLKRTRVTLDLVALSRTEVCTRVKSDRNRNQLLQTKFLQETHLLWVQLYALDE